MNSLKHWISLVIFILAIFLSSNSVYALRKHVPLYKQIDESDLIVIGTVVGIDFVYDKYIKTPEGKILPKIIEDPSEVKWLLIIEVERVMKGDKGVKKVSILEEELGLDFPIYKREEHGLSFLKKVDAKKIQEYKLPPGVYYKAIAKVSELSFPLPYDKIPGYVKTVEKVVKIKSIENDKKRAKAWIKAARSDNEVLKENAIGELWNMKATEAIPTLKTIPKDDELYSFTQAVVRALEAVPKKPIKPSRPINRMIIVIVLGIVAIISIICYFVIRRKKKTTTT